MIIIKSFSYNSEYCRFDISFSDEISKFFLSDEKTVPHITLVHKERDAKGAGTFIPTNTIELNIPIQTKVALIVKDQTEIKTIYTSDYSLF